jgi:hypothetical protein
MTRREHAPPEAARAFSDVLDEVAVAGEVERTVWFGMPAAKVEGHIFLAVWEGALVARLGAEEVDLRILAGGGSRFDPSEKGKPFGDWLQSNAEPEEWPELAFAALAFTASMQR